MKKKRRSPEVKARALEIRSSRRIHSINQLYGYGFLQGFCGGAPDAGGIQIWIGKRAADEQYTAGFMDGRLIRKERQAAAR